ncbi:MAG: hypothetical protein RL204_1886 [Bacteroidota bacterium]|jgi:hypothetical protein
MKKTLFFLACIGWMLSLVAHLLSVADYDIREQLPYIWVLHLGVFIIMLPAIFLLKKENTYREFQQTSMLNQMNPLAGFKVIFKNTPTWLSIIGIAGLVYAFINFFLFFSSMPGTPDIENGQYILHNHGVVSRVLTEQEYRHFQANEVRGFSGHWIAFYGIGMALLYPFKK